MPDDVGPPAAWRSPEELLRLGLTRARLVLVNEAHDGVRRCVRTRRIGARLVREAHRGGVRHLAMEALSDREMVTDANRRRELPEVDAGYLGQPEMRALIAGALTLGWTLVAYEAEMTTKPSELIDRSLEETNWREREQALNLVAAVAELPADARLMVWCGNGHLGKSEVGDWRPMAWHLAGLSGRGLFTIDQLPTVHLGSGREPAAVRWQRAFAGELEQRGGTAGFLATEAPAGWPPGSDADAYLLSLDNELV